MWKVGIERRQMVEMKLGCRHVALLMGNFAEQVVSIAYLTHFGCGFETERAVVLRFFELLLSEIAVTEIDVRLADVTLSARFTKQCDRRMNQLDPFVIALV